MDRRSDLPVRHRILEQRGKILFRRCARRQFCHAVLWQGSLNETGNLLRAVTQRPKTVRNFHLLHHFNQAVGQNPTRVGVRSSFCACTQ